MSPGTSLWLALTIISDPTDIVGSIDPDLTIRALLPNTGNASIATLSADAMRSIARKTLMDLIKIFMNLNFKVLPVSLNGEGWQTPRH